MKTWTQSSFRSRIEASLISSPKSVLAGMLLFSAMLSPIANASDATRISFVKTIESEVHLNRPAHEKDDTNPEPIDNLSKKAYPAAEALAKNLAKGAFDRTDALLVVRAVEDLLYVDPSASGGMILADVRKKKALVDLMNECQTHPSKAPAKAPPAIAGQDALKAAALDLVTQKELCEFKDLMKDLDRLEREGNG